MPRQVGPPQKGTCWNFFIGRGMEDCFCVEDVGTMEEASVGRIKKACKHVRGDSRMKFFLVSTWRLWSLVLPYVVAS